ncbi:MAG: phenylacetate--CoA ligase family protein [Candidatus Bathyarchaeia archaeon]|jgi:phenylacetate-coenzyme A ligase PaaK-like adenylate-forming protein
MDVLRLSLEELAKLSMNNLLKYETLQRASKSSIYKAKWAGINVEKIRTYEDFAQLPYTTTKEVRQAIYEQPIDQILCGKVVHWFSTTGTTGLSKWLPYGRRDLEAVMLIRDRLYNMLPTEDELRLVTITAPPPYIEDGLAILNTLRGMEKKNTLQGITIALTQTDDEEIFNFTFDTKPNVMLAFPSLAARLAEIIEETAPDAMKKQFSEHKTAKNMLLYLITRVKKVHPKDLSKFTWGLFGGEPLDPYREVLTRMYGIEPYEMYTFTEFMPPAVECKMHQGMHLWLDICLPEIIPEKELEKERANSTYVPKALPLWKAKKGQRGEYVLTTFGEALPLVRYRFGDLIEIVGTEPCGCGHTHPRIKVPRRADISVVSLGAIRFPFKQLEEKVLSKTRHGQADRWQLEIRREGHRPHITIRLEPSHEIKSKELFSEEISRKVQEIEVIKTGLDNKILAQPKIIVEGLLLKGKQATAAGSIIFEGE